MLRVTELVIWPHPQIFIHSRLGVHYTLAAKVLEFMITSKTIVYTLCPLGRFTHDHIKSLQITVDHRRSPQITADHHRSPQITADHRRSPQITADHRCRSSAIYHGVIECCVESGVYRHLSMTRRYWPLHLPAPFDRCSICLKYNHTVSLEKLYITKGYYYYLFL